MINIKFINATSVQLVDQAGNTVSNVGEFTSPTEFYYSGDTFSKHDQNYYKFAITGSNVQLSGTIGDVTKPFQYFNLFQGQTAIVDASQLTLAATSVKAWSYANMFLDCTNLISPPIISATTLAEWCYSSMFGNCKKLTYAPELPATTLAKYCYYCMFYNCKEIVDAPYLNATTLADWCYNSMFLGCKKLNSIHCNFSTWSNATTNWVTDVEQLGYFFAPSNLPISTGIDCIPVEWIGNIVSPNTPLTFQALGDNVQVQIFRRNLSASSAWEYKKNDEQWTTYEMVNAYSVNTSSFAGASGEIISLNKDDTVSFRIKSGINGTWSTNVISCSNFYVAGNDVKVFGNPKSLTNYNTQGKYCNLFKNSYYRGYGWQTGQSKIVDAKGVIISGYGTANVTYDYQFCNLFDGCSKLTAAPDLNCNSIATQGYDNMFNNCSSLVTTPKNNAYIFKQYACRQMFQGCTTLTNAIIPYYNSANQDAFDEMFLNCSNLSSIEVMGYDTNVAGNSLWLNSKTTNWVKGVAENGVFIKPSYLSESYDVYNKIPVNWTVIDK